MNLLNAINHLPIGGCQITSNSNTCMGDIELAFCAVSKQSGFSFVSYSFVQANNEENSGAQLNVSFTPIFSTFPERWMEEYVKQGFYHFDAVLRSLEYMAVNARLDYGTWNKARQLALQNPKGENQQQRSHYSRMVDKVFAGAEAHGMRSGIYIIHCAGPMQTIISLASERSSDELDNELKNTFLWNTLLSLTILSNYSINNTLGCDECSRNVRIHGVHEIILTLSQKEILRCYAKNENATVGEIAAMYGVSIDTVKFHLKSIRIKLNKPKISGYALARFAIDHKLI